MNKLTFLELLKAPDKISDADFVELETLVKANPYFQNGHCVLAYAGRKLKKSSSPKLMSSAAIYSVNRNILKQYFQGQIKFTKSSTDTIKKTQAASNPQAQAAPRKAPTLNSDAEQDALVREIYENLEKWKASREHYLDYDKKHPEEIVIEDPFTEKIKEEKREETVETTPPLAQDPPAAEEKQATVVENVSDDGPENKIQEASEINEVEKLKNQVAEEIEAEEETISKALSEITDKTQSSRPKEKESTVDSSEEEESEEDLKPTEKPASKPPAISLSSEELTAIVDAESSADLSETVEEPISQAEDKDAVEEIEQSIEADVQVPPKEIEEVQPEIEKVENLQELDDEPVVIEEVVKNETTIEENTSEEIESSEEIEPVAESDPNDQEDNEEEASLSVQIDVSSDKSTEETEIELSQIDKEIQGLKLNPGSSPAGKKFRLGVLKRGTKFTKGKVKKAPTSNKLKAAPTEEKIKTTEKETTAKTAAKEAVAKKETPKDDKKSTSAVSNTKDSPTKKETTSKAKSTATKKSTSVKKTVTKKTTDKEAESKKTTEKKAAAAKASTIKAKTTKSEQKATAKKAEPKTKKETTKKATPKFRMSASIGSKTPKKSASKKTPKKDDDSSSEKKKPKKVKSDEKPDNIDQVDIIDSFIELNPSIQISKTNPAEDAPIEDLAARYDVFPEHLITENLATILIGQGKAEKAISIYKKLILKNPQKKSYFASQIEKLKKK